MEGQGKWRKGFVETANTYEGAFKNDMKNGYGTFIWGKSGNKYEGDFQDDKRHGYGIYTWQDGVKYEGFWEKNEMHGNGKMIYREGEKQVGLYLYGEFQGKKYRPINKRRQTLNLLRNNKDVNMNIIRKKAILAVGGDHLLIKSNPYTKIIIKRRSKRKNCRSKMINSVNYRRSYNPDSPEIFNTRHQFKDKKKMLNQRLKSASILHFKKRKKNSQRENTTWILEQSISNLRPKSRDITNLRNKINLNNLRSNNSTNSRFRNDSL